MIRYKAAIWACDKGEQWEKALSLLWRMPGKQIEPHVNSYSAAISACEKGEQWEKALALLWETTEKQLEPHVISYSAAICAVAWRGGPALQVLDTMWQCGLEPQGQVFSLLLPDAEWRRDAVHEVEVADQTQAGF